MGLPKNTHLPLSEGMNAGRKGVLSFTKRGGSNMTGLSKRSQRIGILALLGALHHSTLIPPKMARMAHIQGAYRELLYK